MLDLNLLSSISLPIKDNPVYTISPAPIFKCPTSELPICPLGNPTYSPEAWIIELG